MNLHSTSAKEEPDLVNPICEAYLADLGPYTLDNSQNSIRWKSADEVTDMGEINMDVPE